MPDPERLWSPWRMEYIRRGDAGQRDGCLFCDLPAAPPSKDEANHLLARGKVSFALLNAFPYNPGHLMVALGMNLGQVAGAGIADHLHLHLVPRWGGDTNFMPVVGQTKVLPELLAETDRRLRPHFRTT
ncbi:MAG: hypothetical protein K0S88_2173 [Actinomycetia bacterium]|nr:hypothetical protein [Actinomycetes bacterium]